MSAVEKTLKTARVTILEAKLMDAILLSEKDKETAKSNINKEVAPKALEMSKISPLQDIDKLLWSSASTVLKNKTVVTKKAAKKQ